MCVEKWLVSYCQSCCLTLCFSGFYTIITHCFLFLFIFTSLNPLTISTLVFGILSWLENLTLETFCIHSAHTKNERERFKEVHWDMNWRATKECVFHGKIINLVNHISHLFLTFFTLGIPFCTSETEMRYNHYFWGVFPILNWMLLSWWLVVYRVYYFTKNVIETMNVLQKY